MTLIDEVRALVGRSVERLSGTTAEPAIRSLGRRLDEPLRVAVAGRIKAGKSTLLNALVGEVLAPTDAGECTRIVSFYRDGPTYGVDLYPAGGGAPEPLRFVRGDRGLEIDLAGRSPEQVGRLEVSVPSARLRSMMLIDTPGIDSISRSISTRTIEFLAPEREGVSEADAIVYLMRHVHDRDLRFLEAFHDDSIGYAVPANSVGVLSRADELGVCRPDALVAAGRVAARYGADPRVRRLCQTVVPVAGLLAQGAMSLTEHHVATLRGVVAMAEPDRKELLLSVDRFVDDDPDLPNSGHARRELLEQIGLFGVRLGVDLLANGSVRSGPELASALSEASGINDLRRLLLEQFGVRASALKARSTLDSLQWVLTQPGAENVSDLLAEAERIAASAHELAEIRLLNALHAGLVNLPEPDLRRLERLVGGGDSFQRLGVDPTASPDQFRRAALGELEVWQRRAEDPLLDRSGRDAARIAVRTCEGMVGSGHLDGRPGW